MDLGNKKQHEGVDLVLFKGLLYKGLYVYRIVSSKSSKSSKSGHISQTTPSSHFQAHPSPKHAHGQRLSHSANLPSS